MNLIAKHLNKSNLKAKIYEVDTICAFSGNDIKQGVKLSDIIRETFTDYEYIKFESDYMNVDTALLLSEVVPRKEKAGFNSLRSYSYFASEQGLIFLDREHILDLLLDIPETPFCIAVSYNFKKHTAYKCVDNHNTDNFMITTDLYNVLFEREKVMQFLPIIQSWYTIAKDTAQQPTYFSKKEIESGFANYEKIMNYGFQKYEQENKVLSQFRGTHLFELITYLLNKKNNV